MNGVFSNLWQINIELSLLLVATLIARFAIRKTTRIYNSYLLWLSIPMGLLAAILVSQLEFSQPPMGAMNYAVQHFVVAPANSIDRWLAWGSLWLAIAGILLLRLLQQHLALRKELRAITVDTKLQLGSNYPVIGIDKADFSPAVYGFARPVIYFPVQLLEELSPQQTALIIRHEEHHIKQQHLWLNLCWDIFVCLLWFNPLAYVSRQRFRHDQELYCDYLVLHNSTKHSQESYGHALLSTLSVTHSVSLLCSWKTINQIEERIMNINKSTSLSSKFLLSFFGLAIVAGTSLYTVSAADYPDQNKVIEIEEDDGDNRSIEIRKDGKVFKLEGDSRFVIDGEDKREMTKEEVEMIEQEIAEVEKRMWLEKEGTHHKQIRIIRELDDMGLDEEDLLDLAEDLREIEIEILGQHDEFGLARREIEMARKEIEAAHAADDISAKAMQKAIRELEATRSKLGANEAKMRKELERARADVERLRQSMKESRPGTAG